MCGLLGPGRSGLCILNLPPQNKKLHVVSEQMGLGGGGGTRKKQKKKTSPREGKSPKS